MKRKAFTLLELLVVIVVIGILATIATVSFKGDYSAQRKCSENMRQIANAIEQYREATGQYPSDDLAASLKTALVPAYISVATADSIFKCPSDKEAGSTDSYSKFYVQRNDKSKMTSFSVGCPLHDNGTTAINSFFQGQIMKRKLSAANVNPGEKTSSATLADGSTVTGGEVTFLQSFDIGNGKCYSLFKTDAVAKDITLSVTPGSKLEVITPSAIAGVEGTRFVVHVVDADTTYVGVNEGIVRVEEKTGKGVRQISGSASTTEEKIAKVTKGAAPSKPDATTPPSVTDFVNKQLSQIVSKGNNGNGKGNSKN